MKPQNSKKIDKIIFFLVLKLQALDQYIVVYEKKIMKGITFMEIKLSFIFSYYWEYFCYQSSQGLFVMLKNEL